MEPVTFPQQTHVLAKYQPEYRPLPVHKVDEPIGRVISCWQLTPDEVERVRVTGVVWSVQMTFRHALQPQLLSVDSPFDAPVLETETVSLEVARTAARAATLQHEANQRSYAALVADRDEWRQRAEHAETAAARWTFVRPLIVGDDDALANARTAVIAAALLTHTPVDDAIDAAVDEMRKAKP